MTYYAICNVNGPISVRLDNIEDFDADLAREWIDDARTDAEDDLGIDGDGMDEAEFAEAMERAGYAPVEHPEGSVRDGWVLWGQKLPTVLVAADEMGLAQIGELMPAPSLDKAKELARQEGYRVIDVGDGGNCETTDAWDGRKAHIITVDPDTL